MTHKQWFASESVLESQMRLFHGDGIEEHRQKHEDAVVVTLTRSQGILSVPNCNDGRGDRFFHAATWRRALLSGRGIYLLNGMLLTRHKESNLSHAQQRLRYEDSFNGDRRVTTHRKLRLLASPAAESLYIPLGERKNGTSSFVAYSYLHLSSSTILHPIFLEIMFSETINEPHGSLDQTVGH